jgi:hypothetical protein
MIRSRVLEEQRVLYPEEESNMFLQNAGTSLPNYVLYMALHPKRQSS